MNTTSQDLARQQLLELGRNDPDSLITKYRQVAHMDPDETLPIDVSFPGMIDAIVTEQVPVYRRKHDRWKRWK